MALETRPFHVTDYLTNDETIAGYLTEALEGEDSLEIVQAFADVVQAKGGVARLSQQAGIPMEDLTRALDPKGNLDLNTLIKLVHAFGIKLSFSALINESVAA